MKIGLNIAGTDTESDKAAQSRALKNMILNAQKGDWESKDQLVQRFRPLLASLAEKRSNDMAVINKLMEAGKNGLLAAAGRYKPSASPDGFQIFALDFIEANMDRAQKGGGFLSRLFGK